MEKIQFYIELAKIKNKFKTNKELSEKLGITNSAISKILSGKIKMSQNNFMKLLELCGFDDDKVCFLTLEYTSKSRDFFAKLVENGLYVKNGQIYVPRIFDNPVI